MGVMKCEQKVGNGRLSYTQRYEYNIVLVLRKQDAVALSTAEAECWSMDDIMQREVCSIA